MQTIATVYYKYAQKVSNVFYLNLLWILFSGFGLIVFGVSPATTVLYKLSARLLRGENFPIFKTYWADFKVQFVKANLLGGTLVISLYFLLVQYQILSLYNNLYFLIARYIIIGFVFLYLLMTVFILPVFAKYPDATLKELYKRAFIFSIGQPLFSVATLIALTVINWSLLRYLPTVLIFIGVSFNVIIHQWFVERKLGKMVEKAQEFSPEK